MSSFTSRLRRSRWIRTLATPVLSARRRIARQAKKRQLETWDRLTDLLVEDPVVNVPEFGGQFQMDARSHLLQRLVLDGNYEPHLVQLCKRYVPPDRDVIDVGANAGFFSVLLAALAPEQRIMAVEPSRAMIARLRSNLIRNGIEARVDIFEGALTEADGIAQLQGIDGLEEYGTLGALSHPSLQGRTPTRSETVKTTSLDNLVVQRDLSPGFIKVDVEGAEARVFSGATQTLLQHRPVILTEWDDTLLRANGSSALAVLELFDRANYDLFDPMELGLIQISKSDIPHLREALCLPREMSFA